MPDEITIRCFCVEDEGSVIALWQSAFPGDDGYNAPGRVLNRKRDHQDDLFFVAETSAEIVGVVLSGYDGVRGWIYHLAVAETFRNKGIGRRLLAHAETELAKRGCPKVNLQVRLSNDSVQAFYRKCGYLIEDRTSFGKRLDREKATQPIVSTSQPTSEEKWNPSLYLDKHSFVWELGAPLIELLAPNENERILDIGCGTGQLTAELASSGARVVGLDQSAAMISDAQASFPSVEFLVGDAESFSVNARFNAVFSNAAFHWLQAPKKAVECVSKALMSGGRFVAEFGGVGNVAALTSSIQNAFETQVGVAKPHPWYFPSIAEFTNLLESNGFETTYAGLIDRPTELVGSDGLRNWIQMFGQHWLNDIPESDYDSFFEAVEENARPKLFRNGKWFADYRRIRVRAVKQ